MSKRTREIRNARERAEKHTSGFDSTSIKLPEGVKLFKLEAGTMYIDIIPFVVGEGNPFADEGNLHYERTFHVHRNVGPNGDSYICLKKTANKPCPVCEYRAKLAKDPDADEDVIKEMAPKERQLFNVINTKDREAGIQLWDISYHLFGKLLDKRISSEAADEAWGLFHSPTEGMTLVLTVEEKKYGSNTYHEVVAIDFKTRKRQYEDSIVDEAHVLDDLLKLESYDKLKKILLQTDDGTSGDEDEDEKPAKKPGKPSRDEDEDEDEKPAKKKPAADEDEEEEPAPKKKKPVDEDEEEETPKPKKKPAADEDEEEEAPKKKKPAADEDEEEEKPAKKKSFRDEDEDEDEKPAKKKPAADEDEEEPAPKKKKPAADEDEEETPAPKKKKPAADEDEEEEAPKPKKKAADEDDDGWDDEDEKPAKKKKPAADEDDD